MNNKGEKKREGLSAAHSIFRSITHGRTNST